MARIIKTAKPAAGAISAPPRFAESDRFIAISDRIVNKAMKGDRAKSLASGASEYVTKPADITRLISLMRSRLERSPQRDGRSR